MHSLYTKIILLILVVVCQYVQPKFFKGFTFLIVCFQFQTDAHVLPNRVHLLGEIFELFWSQ